VCARSLFVVVLVVVVSARTNEYCLRTGSSWWSLPVKDALGSVFFLPSTWRMNRIVVVFLSFAFLALHLPPW